MRIAALALAIATLASSALYAYDVHQDRLHHLAPTETVPVFAADRLDCGREERTPVASVGPANPVRVLRIRYGKDCQTVKIQMASGQTGWLLGDGSFSVEMLRP